MKIENARKNGKKHTREKEGKRKEKVQRKIAEKTQTPKRYRKGIVALPHLKAGIRHTEEIS